MHIAGRGAGVQLVVYHTVVVEFEFGGDEDFPKDGLGRFAVVVAA